MGNVTPQCYTNVTLAALSRALTVAVPIFACATAALLARVPNANLVLLLLYVLVAFVRRVGASRSCRYHSASHSASFSSYRRRRVLKHSLQH